MSPRQVDELTIWEFNAAVDGYMQAHGGEPALPPPTQAEHEALIAKYG